MVDFFLFESPLYASSFSFITISFDYQIQSCDAKYILSQLVEGTHRYAGIILSIIG